MVFQKHRNVRKSSVVGLCIANSSATREIFFDLLRQGVDEGVLLTEPDANFLCAGIFSLRDDLHSDSIIALHTLSKDSSPLDISLLISFFFERFLSLAARSDFSSLLRFMRKDLLILLLTGLVLTFRELSVDLLLLDDGIS